MSTICTKCGFQEDELHMAATASYGTSQWRDLQRARLDETKEKILALQAHIDTLQARLDTFDAQRCELEKTMESFVYPVATIPVELITQIFILCLPENGRVRPSECAAPLSLAQVCRHWRDIALSIPQLWRSVDLELQDSLSFSADDGVADTSSDDEEFSPYLGACRLLKTWFRRTNGYPLSITLRCHRDDCDAMPPNILVTIAEFSQQWGRLEVIIPRDDVPALRHIAGPFPKLHTFALGFTDRWRQLDFPQVESLAAYQDGPRLLELRGLRLVDLRPATATLTSLDLCELLSTAEWTAIFERFPALLHLSAYHNREVVYSPPPAHEKSPPLESLVVRAGIPLPALTLPHLRRLQYPLGSSALSISAFLSFITRSACMLQYLTLSITLSDEETYLDCLRAVPSLVKLEVAPYGAHHHFYEHLQSPVVLPQLTELIVSEDGYKYDSAPLVRMLRARRDPHPTRAQLRSFSLVLDLRGRDPDYKISPLDGPTMYRLRRLVDGGLRLHICSKTQGDLWPAEFHDVEINFP
ncbi:hypothetical protein C8R44DRAFT_297984 [Mycena epipterygia]|nr:hypothetical protein C8R44DRAFT_297984 [Mycena epipterygia]